MLKEIKSTKGITLVALTITIVVLLILAGVSIVALTGENGILNKAVTVKENIERLDLIEQMQIEILGEQSYSDREISEIALKEILEKYGTLNYKEDKTTMKSITTNKGNYEIAISEIWSESVAIEATPESVVDEGWDEIAKVNKPKTINKSEEKYVTWTENNGTYEINDTQTEIPEEWYDYDNGKWANIKTTGNGYNAYWVWIPRYEYVVPTSTTATQIEVKFIPTTQTTADDGYTIHPAFTFNGQQLAGIWVAKFEASSSSPSSSYGGGDSTSLNVQVLPNVTSWRKITTNNIFTVCRNMQTGGTLGTVSDTVVNSHMMKNIEWGAVAILSQSKYGIYNLSSKTGLTTNGGDGTLQVWNNPYYTSTNTVLKTGYVSSSTSGKDATSTTSCDEYNTGNGPKGSTTGTVYGVYDMAGGAYEYVAGCISGYEDTKFGVTEGDSTYVDLYTNASNSYSDYTGAITGDATTETKGWNDDYSNFVDSSNPVFRRGGNYNNGTSAGVFSFIYTIGNANNSYGFRVVLAAF